MTNYPKSFDPVPEQIYSVKMTGGVIPEGKDNAGSRYPKPRIFKKEHLKEDGSGTWWSWNVTILAKEVINLDTQPTTDDDTLGEYTLWIPEEVREEVDDLFNRDIYKFYLRKKATWYKDKKGKDRSKGVYQVSAGLSGFKDIQEKIFNVKPTPQPTPKVEEEIPFNNYKGDDEIAFKEDLQGEINRPKGDIQKVNKAMEKVLKDIQDSGIIKCLTDMEEKNGLYFQQIVGTLQNIEEDLRKLSNGFAEMLDKFTVKIKRER